jgi:hypothetical protein
MFCRHKWKLVSEKETESPFDIMMRETGRAPRPSSRYDITSLFQKKLIHIFVCDKCPKIKRIITNINCNF